MSVEHRHAHAWYCDDIRHEEGGKLSYMGVYSNALYTPSFPYVLPKLCVNVVIVTPANEPFQALKVVIRKDEKVLIDIDIPEHDISRFIAEMRKIQISDVQNDLDLQRRYACTFNFVFQPLLIESAGWLRVRAYLDGQELRANALRIENAPSSSNVGPPSES